MTVRSFEQCGSSACRTRRETQKTRRSDLNQRSDQPGYRERHQPTSLVQESGFGFHAAAPGPSHRRRGTGRGGTEVRLAMSISVLRLRRRTGKCAGSAPAPVRERLARDDQLAFRPSRKAAGTCGDSLRPERRQSRKRCARRPCATCPPLRCCRRPAPPLVPPHARDHRCDPTGEALFPSDHQNSSDGREGHGGSSFERRRETEKRGETNTSPPASRGASTSDEGPPGPDSRRADRTETPARARSTNACGTQGRSIEVETSKSRGGSLLRPRRFASSMATSPRRPARAARGWPNLRGTRRAAIAGECTRVSCYLFVKDEGGRGRGWETSRGLASPRCTTAGTPTTRV